MFHALLQEVIDGVTDFNGFSVQSVSGDTRSHIYLKGWKGNLPFAICLGTFDRFTKFPLGEISSLAGFLSCFPQAVPSVATIGFPSYFSKTLDHATGAKTSTVCVPTFGFKELCDVLRTPTASVFGKADLIGLLDYIAIRMRTASSESWISDSTHLRIVSIHFCFRSSRSFPPFYIPYFLGR